MEALVFAAVIVALLAAFVILFLARTGAREWMQVHSPKLLADMFSCDFCLSWWICLFLAIILVPSWTAIVIAILATPLTRYLL